MAQGTWNGKKCGIAVRFNQNDWNRLNAFARRCDEKVSTIIRELTLAELARHDRP